MGNLLNLITPLHTSTKREYLPRMLDDKVQCMLKAKEYEFDYWDGDRRYGYGGYRYLQGYWTPVAEGLIERYGLKQGSRILDVGCGKGFLLYELHKLSMEVCGFDVSRHALAEARPEIRSNLFLREAEKPFPYTDEEFDLVISVNSLHNLPVFNLKKALGEMERVGRNKYLCVESFRNEQELFNLQCWALTCESFFSNEEWEWLFNEFGYSGDYEFIYFE
ncbi:class I SAM-dependent methyltransferase [Maridesulfovibrio sp.]|uniref:class I SAM-dependent methyltransferase n=1 Tax=Maridesulfovibrio sp. TaxID=2795000 RepID=UPI0029C9B584|nr:class I SAM-dependent methyltransferase [Maridesulfovibrio sp.]